jgi:hypothetical protein
LWCSWSVWRGCPWWLMICVTGMPMIAPMTVLSNVHDVYDDHLMKCWSRWWLISVISDISIVVLVGFCIRDDGGIHKICDILCNHLYYGSVFVVKYNVIMQKYSYLRTFSV